MRLMPGLFVVAALVLSSLQGATTAGAQRPDGNDPVGKDSAEKDLRDIRIGMAVADLPAAGYVNFTCADVQGRAIASWTDWAMCPADRDGLHAIRFDYDPSASREGTMVAGHPAILTLLADGEGAVAGLRIETDPDARLYMRKKAFLLATQVKSRYGADGWTCSQAPRGDGEQPVGGLYIQENCLKTVQGRSITVERRLFRRPDQDAKSFVDETRIVIRRSGR
jgi:hypothetical protein